MADTNPVYQDRSIPVAIETFYEEWNFTDSTSFNEPFTQATFYNFDPANILQVNNFPVPANTAHVISLNTNQVNATSFKIKSASPTRSLWIAFSIISGYDPRASRS